MRISDWSSDVCSSDLSRAPAPGRGQRRPSPPDRRWPSTGTARTAGRGGRRRGSRGSRARARRDRKSVVEGKSVSVRVDLGGRRIIKKKKNINNQLFTK